MRFAIKSNYSINGGINASSKGTSGKNLFGKLFGGSEKKEDSKIESFDNQHGIADLEIDGEIEASLDLNVEELKELASYTKSNLENEKESVRFLYNGMKKFVSDLASGIEAKGKDIVNSIYDVKNEWQKREHESSLQNIRNVQEKENLRNELSKKSK